MSALNPDSPDEMALGRLRAPISIGRSNSYAGSSSRILTDPTGERRSRRFRQHFRGLRSCRPNPSGESGLTNSSLAFYQNSNTPNFYVFNLQYSDFCKTKIVSGLSERQARFFVSYANLRQVELSGDFRRADFLAADFQGATLDGLEADYARFAAAKLNTAI